MPEGLQTPAPQVGGALGSDAPHLAASYVMVEDTGTVVLGEFEYDGSLDGK